MADMLNSLEPGKPRRRWFQFRLRTLLVGVVLLAAVYGLIKWTIRSQNPFSWLPRDSDIAQMIATSAADFDSSKPGTDVPRSQIPVILATLSEGRVDRNPYKWVVLGVLTCRMKSGENVEIQLYDAFNGELAFSRDEDHYFRGADARKLTAILGWTVPNR